ncbi:Dynein alpha chain, flagellar outer arm [Rhizoctonia solani]|uniref:Dynein alpha chain, flagellar outer arm n=1 Tax=Rhizoctonia solani TaxID=456999 RepID=A0A0K6FM26_9AGAM|nr:Dynein alpha chain, flagellar outer arm [Rhizoctonia solani]
MSTDALPSTLADVPVALARVADQLAAGTLTRDDADDYLSHILGLGLWSAFPEDHLDSLRDSWTRLFDSREAERDRAGNSGTDRPNNRAGPSGARGGTTRNSPDPDSEGDLQRRAQEALAQTEKRRIDSKHDATIRSLLETIMGDHGNAAIDKTKYDFVADSGGIEIPANMHPDAAKTVCKAEYYSRSIDTARSALLLQPRKPEFPYLLWNELLRNQFIDLNKVFSHLHASTETTKLSERIGDHISLVTTTSRAPTKKIKTFGEWSYTWSIYRRAIVFVFNHRGDEMDHWATFISRIFSTTNESRHGSVIEMEAAMRRFIFDNQSRCLWDHIDVMHLQHAYLGVDGSRSTQNQSNKRPNSSESSRSTKKSRPARATVFTNTDAPSVRETMEPMPAPKRRRTDREHGAASKAANERLGDQSFRRGFLWRDNEALDSPSADSTIHATPFADIPDHELKNSVALKTIEDNPHIFKIVTPFNVDRFEQLLKTHPNRPLVESACRGLREGFWPHADTSAFIPTDPELVPNHPMGARELDFLKSQRDEELSTGRFSPPFRTLYPGMQSSALGAVPKPHSDKLRLITDQSIGRYSLNSFIDKTDVRVRYDNLTDLGRSLRAIRSQHGDDIPLVLWKSDIAHAFRCIPMHPLWQIRQVVAIDGSYHVDRCMVFGSRASPIIWCKIAGLIAWIAIHVRRLLFLHHYMDDYWSIERGIFPVLYKKYGDMRPHSQVQFLTLLDELGVPHDRSKQIFGECIVIIGFEVDTRAMTIRMGDIEQQELAAAILAFLDAPKRSQPLRKWQCILGWANWALNAIPHARPALSSAYRKIAGKTVTHAPIYLNVEVKHDLRWFVDRLRSGSGLSLIQGNSWDEAEADVTIFCDACPSGMGFWSPSHWKSFYYRCPPESAKNSNFCEAATIVSALQWALSLNLPLNPRILIYSDNLAAVEVFSSMRGNPPYFEMTLQAAAWVHDFGLLWQTLHVPGLDNTIADYLSRGMLDRYETHSHRSRPQLPPSNHRYPIMPAEDSSLVPASHKICQPPRSAWSLDRLRHERAIALGFALETRTQHVYNSSTASWLSFCKLHGFSSEPTADTLSFYAVWMCGAERPVKPSTVVGYLSGICNNLEPFYPSVQSIRNERLVSKTLAGLKRRFGTAPKQKRAMSVQEVADVAIILGSSTIYDDKLFLAILMAGFHALHRLGELCWPNETQHQSYRRLITRHSASLDDDAFSYLLPAHKADPGFRGSHIRIVKQWDKLDPIPIFRAYLTARDSQFGGFLELWLTSSGNTPTKSWFSTRLKQYCASDLTGHSLRSGGATALALSGVPNAYIQKLGRWSSDAWQGYVRAHPTVLLALMDDARQNA